MAYRHFELVFASNHGRCLWERAFCSIPKTKSLTSANGSGKMSHKDQKEVFMIRHHAEEKWHTNEDLSTT